MKRKPRRTRTDVKPRATDGPTRGEIEHGEACDRADFAREVARIEAKERATTEQPTTGESHDDNER